MGRTALRVSKYASTIVAAAIGLLTVQTTAVAEDFPNRAITIVVPFGPGTGNDIIARQVGQHMMAALGQSVVVDNRPGATGNIASDYVAKSPPERLHDLPSELEHSAQPARRHAEQQPDPRLRAGGAERHPALRAGGARRRFRSRPSQELVALAKTEARRALLRRLYRRRAAVPGRDAQPGRQGQHRDGALQEHGRSGERLRCRPHPGAVHARPVEPALSCEQAGPGHCRDRDKARQHPARRADHGGGGLSRSQGRGRLLLPGAQGHAQARRRQAERRDHGGAAR